MAAQKWKISSLCMLLKTLKKEKKTFSLRRCARARLRASMALNMCIVAALARI